MIDKKTAPYAALALRLVTGALFLAHGLTKLLVFTIPGTVGFFESLGLPAIVAYLTIIAEIGGGAALILGVLDEQVDGQPGAWAAALEGAAAEGALVDARGL